MLALEAKKKFPQLVLVHVAVIDVDINRLVKDNLKDNVTSNSNISQKDDISANSKILSQRKKESKSCLRRYR